MNGLYQFYYSFIQHLQDGKKEQNKTSISDDEFPDGKNNESFDEPDVGKKEIRVLKLVDKAIITLKLLSKISSKRCHDHITKIK